MTMTGCVMADQIGSEFLPDVSAVPWAHEFGAIDAPEMLPAGSTVPCFKGNLGFGIPEVAWRGKWKTT